jgi:hypothetical protein
VAQPIALTVRVEKREEGVAVLVPFLVETGKRQTQPMMVLKSGGGWSSVHYCSEARPSSVNGRGGEVDVGDPV